MAVFEVFEPALERAIHVRDDLGHTVPGCSLGLRPDRVPELLAAFATRPVFAGLEVVAKKVMALRLNNRDRRDQPGDGGSEVIQIDRKLL